MTVKAAAVPQVRDGRYAWFVCLVMVLCMTFSYMDRTVLSLLIVPIQKDFGLDDTTLSLIQGTAFGIFYSVFGLPMARIADTWQRRNLIIIGVVIWCLATCACGLATGRTSLFVARIVVAVGEAVLMPSAVSIIADYFSPERRLRALNAFSMGIYLGGGIALGLGGVVLHSVGASGAYLPLIGQAAGWRVVFLTIGAAGLVMIPLLLCVREPVRLTELGAASVDTPSFRDVVAIFRERRVALLTTILGFATISMSAQAIQGWMPTLFIRSHGWSSGSAGLSLGLTTLICGPLGAFAGVLLSEAFARREYVGAKLMVGISSAAACAIAAILVTLANSSLAFAGAVALQFVVAFNFGTVQAALTDILPNRARGMGTASYVMTSNLLTAALGPLAIGLITDHVFHDKAALPLSLRLFTPAGFLVGLALLVGGLGAYIAAVRRQRAMPDQSVQSATSTSASLSSTSIAP